MPRRTTAHRWRHESASITAAQPDRARLVIVADTHSRPHAAAAALIAAQQPDAILHGGDVGDLAVLDGLRAIAPLHAVRGNIDGRADLPDSIAIGLRDADGRPLLLMLLQHIAVYGPRLRADAARRARDVGARAVVCGHSHVPFLGEDRGLLVFNPGSIGPRRFQLPITFGVLEVGPRGLSAHHVSCVTGEPWMPGQPG